MRKKSAGAAMRNPVRIATARLKRLVLCVSNQSGALAIADRSTGTSAACRMMWRPRSHESVARVGNQFGAGQSNEAAVVPN